MAHATVGLRSVKRPSVRGAAGAVVLVGLTAIGVLVLPPATLSPEMAKKRTISMANQNPKTNTAEIASTSGDYSQFGIKEWASVLSYSSDWTFYKNKQTSDLTGFVVASERDPDVFILTRFAITCCAVDASPVGVPVYLPRWRESYKDGDWLRVKGDFMNGSQSGLMTPIALRPLGVMLVSEPEDPYVYQ